MPRSFSAQDGIHTPEHCARLLLSEFEHNLTLAAVDRAIAALPNADMACTRPPRASDDLTTIVGAGTVCSYYINRRAAGYPRGHAGEMLLVRDVCSGVFAQSWLAGTLRSRRDFVWVTFADSLDAAISDVPQDDNANRTRELLGLGLMGPHQHLFRFDFPRPNAHAGVVAVPTSLDAGGYPYFLTSTGPEAFGRTLDLVELRPALPELIVRGVRCADALLRYVGSVTAVQPFSWAAWHALRVTSLSTPIP